MASDKVGDLYVNYSNNHIGSNLVVSNTWIPSTGQDDYSSAVGWILKVREIRTWIVKLRVLSHVLVNSWISNKVR